MKIKFLLVLALSFLLIVAPNLAHPSGEDNLVIVPDQERDITAEGPTENKFIESVQMLGSIPLENEFTSLKGRVLRTREITILPHGQVAVHQHQSRPGMAYILEGELIEYRNDQSVPVIRGVGSVAFEKTGLIHWWANKSSRKARVLVVDIVPQET